MSAGSPEDEGGASGSPPDPMDRLWIHPAELGARMRQVRQSRSEGGGRHWLAGSIGGAVGALITAGALALFGVFDRPTNNAPTAKERRADTAEIVARVVAQAGPSVLGVSVTAGTGKGSKRASAVCIGKGRALTTADVVDGGGTVTVSTVDGRSAKATVVGVDPLTDLALVKFDQLTVPEIQIGSADALQTGRQVISVGMGRVDQHWVSTGVISSLDGLVEVRPGRTLAEMVQTDNSVSSEAGGGALVDPSGVLVGILNPAKTQSGGLATPINVATSVAQQLAGTGKAEHGWLGVAGADHDGSPNGVDVTAVVTSSPAAKAGIVPGNIITHVNGHSIEGMAQLMGEVRRRRPGDGVDLTIVQGGGSKSVMVRLGTWADTPDTAVAPPTSVARITTSG
jgi:putative serine protease PepD